MPQNVRNPHFHKIELKYFNIFWCTEMYIKRFEEEN